VAGRGTAPSGEDPHPDARRPARPHPPRRRSPPPAAAGLGLAQTLDPSRLTPDTLAEALIHLPDQPPPATQRVPGLLDGLRFINQAVAKWRVEGPPGPGIRALERAGRRAHSRRAV
jgi:hypothetical protein